jgi:hypothetical protein
MKICIISSGRCGSSSLFNCIDEHLPKFYYSSNEPFHKLKTLDEVNDVFLELNKKENVFIKTLIGQGSERFTIIDGELVNVDMIENVEFNDWLYNTFDKIILIDRRDDKLQLESMAYHAYLNNNFVWHRKKFYEIKKIPQTLLEFTQKNLLNIKNMMNYFGSKYQFKIYYYEDIFIYKNMEIINEIFDYLEIPPDKGVIEKYILSEKYKVRLNKMI